MITYRKILGYKVYLKDDNHKYIDIFLNAIKYKVECVKVLRNIDDIKVSLIRTEHGLYIFKVFAPKSKKLERFLKSFVKGDYYKNLIIQTDRVREKGNEFPNDFYLLAERKILNYASVFIMLIEYINGIELDDMECISEEIKTEIKQKMDKLHSDKMLSGDPHRGNFIVEKSGVRIIDLSGKYCNSQRMAKDRLAMERHLGIKNDKKDVGYYLVVYKLKLRNFLKKIKGKK